MACALSLSSNCSATTMLKPSPKVVSFRIRACMPSPRDDEGSRPSRHIVDMEMSVLRERMEQVKMKERLESCLKHQNGWNYEYGYGYNHINKNKNEKKKKEFLELAGLAFGAFGSSLVFGTLFICFISIFLNLNQFMVQF